MTDDEALKAGSASAGVGGPFVTTATFCERILTEQDGVNTLVRVVDRYWYDPTPPELVLPVGVKEGILTYLLVTLKSGEFLGSATLTVSVRKPSGSYAPKTVTTPVTFKGDEHGISLAIAFNLATEEDGLYWFDVALDEKLLTRVPLRIAPRQKSAPAGDAASRSGGEA